MQKSLPYLWPKWRQNSQNRYPIYDQNGWKTLLFGAAHTYIAHIREYPPPRGILGLVIDRDPHCNTHRVKEEIHIRLHSYNINRDSRIEGPEAWLPLIKKNSNRSSVRQLTSEAKAHTNNGVRNAPLSAANNRPTRTSAWSHISSRVTNRRRLARQGL